MLPFDWVCYISAFFLAVGIFYFFTANDELPLLLILLYLVSGLYRYWIIVYEVTNIKVYWVRVAYAREIFVMSDEIGLQALNYFLLGTGVMMTSYIIFCSIIKAPAEQVDQREMFASYIIKKRYQVIITFFIFTILNFYSRSLLSSAIADNQNITAGFSYLLLLPFAIGGLILLMYLVFKSIDIRRDFASKLVFGALIVISAITSYNPGTRFNFLSWTIALGIIFVRDRKPAYKVRIYIVAASIIIGVYAMAGLSRTPGSFLLSPKDQAALAIDRLVTAEDQNLLDGFMMVLQVYPANLSYQYGFQHLEILLRPIPRAIWPNKPVGGYANKLGLNDNMTNSTIGISESIYGSFYGEGGIVGILLGCIIYGWFFAWLHRRSQRYNSDMQFLVKGMTIASLVAIIRGGDLAGIMAFVGMSYWPVFIFMRQYGNFVVRFNAWFSALIRGRQIRRQSVAA